MRSSVITNEEAKEHFVENYRFKILSQEKKDDGGESGDINSQMIKNQEAKISQTQTNEDLENLSDDKFESINDNELPSAQPSFVEELLKRIDEMSGSIIKLQMQIENQEAEFARRLETEVSRAREDGVRAGLQEAGVKFDEELKGLQTRFLSSISKLEDEAQKFTDLLISSEAELPNTAIDIAKEVIQKEISTHSSRVAISLCNALLKEVKEAKRIQIKVNPNDFDFIKDSFSNSENIKISSDDAINVGGVIILSDIGNLDGTIEARLEKIRKLVSE